MAKAFVVAVAVAVALAVDVAVAVWLLVVYNFWQGATYQGMLQACIPIALGNEATAKLSAATKFYYRMNIVYRMSYIVYGWPY